MPDNSLDAVKDKLEKKLGEKVSFNGKYFISEKTNNKYSQDGMKVLAENVPIIFNAKINPAFADNKKLCSESTTWQSMQIHSIKNTTHK